MMVNDVCVVAVLVHRDLEIRTKMVNIFLGRELRILRRIYYQYKV